MSCVKVDLTGKTFFKLKVLKIAGKSSGGNYKWLCICECGNEKIYSHDHLTRKSGSVKSCGCLKQRKLQNHKQFNGVGEISGGWWYNKITRPRKRRAPLEVTITKEYAWKLFLKQNRKCALSGIQLNIGYSGNASIDRIDSSKGYIPGNIQWVDRNVNFMKGTLTQDVFISRCKLIAQFISGICEIN